MHLKTKKVKTKKIHQCFGCCQIIPVNRIVEYFVGINDGDFSYGYTCEICQIVLENYVNLEFDGPSFYEGDLIQDYNTWIDAAQKFQARTGTHYNNAILGRITNGRR